MNESTGPPPPPPPPSPSPQSAPTYSWPPAGGTAPPEEGQLKRQSRRNIVIAVAIVAVLAIGGGVAAVLISGASRGTVNLPATIAGQPKVSSPALEGLAKGVAEGAKIGSDEPKVGFYGSEAHPDFMVMAYTFSTPGLDTEFQTAETAFERSSGGTVDRAETSRAANGAAHFDCAPFTTANLEGFLCMWADDKTTGAVFALSRSHDPIDLVQQVHDAVVG